MNKGSVRGQGAVILFNFNFFNKNDSKQTNSVTHIGTIWKRSILYVNYPVSQIKDCLSMCWSLFTVCLVTG